MAESAKEERRVLYTVKQFIDSLNGAWPTESALRAIILDASWNKNKFQSAFKRVNRRVLVDPTEFWKIVDRMQEVSNHVSDR